MAKVAEYQARGVVHFHAIFRLDGPNPGDLPPAGANVELLAEAIRQAAAVAHLGPPQSDALAGLNPIRWGEQLDLRPIVSQPGEGPSLSDGQVAGYIAKYATKGAEACGTVDRPIACRRCQGAGRYFDNDRYVRCANCKATGARMPIDRLGINPHAAAMINTCWKLGGLPELEHLRLRPWSHMLGFRGHFATKSRRYSVTLSCLRSVRQQWRTAHTLQAHGLEPNTPVRRYTAEGIGESDQLDNEDEDAVLIVGNWKYIGRGHSAGEAIYARTIAHDIKENRRMARQAIRGETLRMEGAA